MLNPSFLLSCRRFNCERIPCLRRTLTRSSKIGAFQNIVHQKRHLTVAHRWWDFGADAYVVRHCLLVFPGVSLTSGLDRIPTNTFG